MGKNARVYSNTFWSKKRCDNNLSIKDLSDLLGSSYTQTSKYLTGQTIPPEPAMHKICELFDVEFDVGKKEFYDAHANWEDEKNSKAKSTENVTFWQQQRLNKKVTLEQVAKEMPIDYSYLSKCLSGAVLPSTPMACKICDYFGVDYIKGAEEFNKAHNEWIIANPGKTKNRDKVHTRKYVVSDPPKATVVSETPQPTSAVATVSAYNPLSEIALELLYGIVSYKEYENIRSGNLTGKQLLEFLYKKVDFDVFWGILQTTGMLF